MKSVSLWRRFLVLSILVLLASSCGTPSLETGAAVTPTPVLLLPEYGTAAPAATFTGTTGTEEAQPEGAGEGETPTAGVALTGHIHLGDLSIEIPEDWYWTQVNPDHLDSLLFMEHNPTVLAEFDDPNLALPMDFEAGALVVTASSDDIDPLAWQQSAVEGYMDLEDGDLEAMLLAIDQVGLINLAVVDNVRLEGTSLDKLGEQFALKMEGEVFFTEDTPPVLHLAVWLCRIEGHFVAYYAMASEDLWQSSEAVFKAVADTFQID